jgi:hypothetical protein
MARSGSSTRGSSCCATPTVGRAASSRPPTT